MKLKILAIVALAAVGVGAAFVALGGLPASASTTTRYLTGAVDDRRRHRRRRRDRLGRRERVVRRGFGSPAHLASATAASGSGSSTTWTVTDVKVKVGDTVKKGAVLATADTADLKRQLADANTAVDDGQDPAPMAKASLTDANTAPSPRRSARRRSASTTPKSQVADATKTRDDVKTQIRLATLTAPIDGIVTDRQRRHRASTPHPATRSSSTPTTFQVTADVVESDLAGDGGRADRGGHHRRRGRDRSTGKVTAIAPTAAGSTHRRRRVVRGHRLARRTRPRPCGRA